MQDYKIYEMNYLMNEDLTDKDLHYLFDTPSLFYSFVIEQFKRAKSGLNKEEILKLVKEDDKWTSKYKLTKRAMKSFYNEIKEAFKNVYNISEYAASWQADVWMLRFGFLCK